MTGNGIPQLYVVRADGEQLYGGAGSLPGDALPQMLLAAMNRAGRSFNAEQAKFLQNQVNAASESLVAGNRLGAAVALAELGAMGGADNLQSFAAPATKAGELYQELRTQIDQAVKDSTGVLLKGEPGSELTQLLVLSEAEASFRLFPKWKADANLVMREVRREAKYEEGIQQASALVKARLAAASPQVRVKNRAASLYANVMKKYPGTEASEIARKELSLIEPDSKFLEGMEIAPESEPDPSTSISFRTWSTNKGDFTTRAKYVAQSAGKVQLLKESGEIITVEIRVLSERDREYLELQKAFD